MILQYSTTTTVLLLLCDLLANPEVVIIRDSAITDNENSRQTLDSTVSRQHPTSPPRIKIGSVADNLQTASLQFPRRTRTFVLSHLPAGILHRGVDEVTLSQAVLLDKRAVGCWRPMYPRTNTQAVSMTTIIFFTTAASFLWYFQQK